MIKCIKAETIKEQKRYLIGTYRNQMRLSRKTTFHFDPIKGEYVDYKNFFNIISPCNLCRD